MAQQNIDFGNFVWDLDADIVREAFEKTQNNFTELYNFKGQTVRAQERFVTFVESEDPVIVQVTNSINNAPVPIVVPAGMAQFISIVQAPSDDVGVNDFYIKTMYLLERGQGTYGAGQTQITQGDLLLINTVEVSPTIIPLGNIGSSTIEDFVNVTGAYVITGLTIFTATISSVEKIYAFQGANGTYGQGATQTTADNFIDLTTQATIPVISPLLSAVKRAGNPHTLSPKDLNRFVQLTSNDVTVNIADTIVELAANVGIFSITGRLKFEGTGTHTVNFPTAQSKTFTQGDIVIYERGVEDGEWDVYLVNDEEAVLGTLHNTVIGGVGGTITTKALLAAQLTGVSASDISNFFIVGSDVYAQINANITNIGDAFEENCTSYIDLENRVTVLGVNDFQSNTSLVTAKLNGLSTLPTNALRSCSNLTTLEIRNVKSISSNNTLQSTSSLNSLDARNLESVSGIAFLRSTALTSLQFPRLKSINSESGQAHFSSLPAAANFYAPNLKSITGTSSGDVFGGITSGTITVHSDLSVANSGQEHAALAAARAAGATIVYHQTDKWESADPAERASTSGNKLLDSTESNRPTIHNGTAWKGLAYTDEIPTTPTLDEVLGEGNSSEKEVILNGGLLKFGGLLDGSGADIEKTSEGIQIILDSATDQKTINLYSESQTFPRDFTFPDEDGTLATQEQTIPITGTEVGNPVTGDIETTAQIIFDFLGDKFGIEHEESSLLIYSDFGTKIGALRIADDGVIEILQTDFNIINPNGSFTELVTNATLNISLQLPDESGTLATTDYFAPLFTDSLEITFDRPRKFKDFGTAGTGNITEDLTGAKAGIVQKIYHDDSSAPTVPAGWVLIGGEYVTDELNIIYAEWVSGTRIEYWIVQS